MQKTLIVQLQQTGRDEPTPQPSYQDQRQEKWDREPSSFLVFLVCTLDINPRSRVTVGDNQAKAANIEIGLS